VIKKRASENRRMNRMVEKGCCVGRMAPKGVEVIMTSGCIAAYFGWQDKDWGDGDVRVCTDFLPFPQVNIE
jgi:hypothetical protein